MSEQLHTDGELFQLPDREGTDEDHNRRMHERIASMTYSAIRAYFIETPEGAGGGPGGFLPWHVLSTANTDALTRMVSFRLTRLCAGQRLPTLEARPQSENFNLGLSAYLMDTIVTAVYDYTMARAEFHRQQRESDAAQAAQAATAQEADPCEAPPR